MNAGTRLATRMIQPLRRAVLKRRVGRLVCEQVEGLSLVVLPDVFNPAVFGSSDVLVRALRAFTAARGSGRGRLLDMGTGTGIAAIAAAKLGYDVVAIDVNPDAVRCARMNAVLHGVDGRVTARLGDLCVAVVGELFDVVLFNPPFFAGSPASALDQAWRSLDVPERFGAGLPSVLARGGRALVVVSSHGGRARTEHALAAAGIVLTPAFTADLGYEIVTVLEAARRGSA
jgi:methylase of polypeptide subunit release factors